MNGRIVDLNADMGESFGRWQLGDDAALLRIVSSANVACGFHAGDPSVLLSTCRSAAANGVVIGAQVGYRDLAGFGRRFMDVDPDELTADVLYQLSALDGLARVAGSKVRYLKPHGALYNAVVTHESQAAAIVTAITKYDASLPVLGLPDSALLRIAAEQGLRTVAEAFADRAYTAEGTLVSRREPESVLFDPHAVAERVLRIVTAGEVVAITGETVSVRPDSICLHSDTADAALIAAAVRSRLDDSDIRVRSFV
ncbi:5-oxoprolinase subunit PxpA [Saxibacter everestensis]|uniref:5-oxoprolinase subunit A n=1 Tax=Saxibacter everestensis TaxID=2909229 RepID=A0ABY8QZ52_9MICO|nr:5-oxoprolinase subunit PxpA [Brevibacteriaceae bacterium ZFBP1038]